MISFSTFCGEASGSTPRPNVTIHQGAALTSESLPTFTLVEVKEYFLERVSELENDCKNETAWVFVCAAVFLEYLAAMTIEKKDESGNKIKSEKRYELFVERYLGDDYTNFEYHNENESARGLVKNDLPTQMYCVLRSAMVHSFSMIPESATHTQSNTSGSNKDYARSGSIVICHAKSCRKHLSNFGSDAACFVAEVFVQDIRKSLLKIFNEAETDSALRVRIMSAVTIRPPLHVLNEAPLKEINV